MFALVALGCAIWELWLKDPQADSAPALVLAALAFVSLILDRQARRRLREPVIVADAREIRGRTMWGRMVIVRFGEIEQILWETESLGLGCRTRRVVIPYAALGEADRGRVGTLVRERMAGAAPDPILLEQGMLARRAWVRRYKTLRLLVLGGLFLAMIGWVVWLGRDETHRPDGVSRERPRPFDPRGHPVASGVWAESPFVGTWRLGQAADWIDVLASGRALRCQAGATARPVDENLRVLLSFGVLRADWSLDWRDEGAVDHLWAGEADTLTMGPPGRSAIYRRVDGLPRVCTGALTAVSGD